jgi:hypothetical protein
MAPVVVDTLVGVTATTTVAVPTPAKLIAAEPFVDELLVMVS